MVESGDDDVLAGAKPPGRGQRVRQVKRHRGHVGTEIDLGKCLNTIYMARLLKKLMFSLWKNLFTQVFL